MSAAAHTANRFWAAAWTPWASRRSIAGDLILVARMAAGAEQLQAHGPSQGSWLRVRGDARRVPEEPVDAR